MRNLITVSLAAGLLAICPSTLLAQTSTNAPANSGPITAPTPSAAKKGAQRREIVAILGFTRADLKGLTAEARTAKLKTAADKKIAQLESKQADGPLTAKEQSDLALLKKFEHHGHGKG